MTDWNDELASAFSLREKTVVINGAGSGLGQEAARIFALAGARLVLTDIDEAGLGRTVELAGSHGILARRIDAASRDELETLADWAVESTGGLDVWINAAGVSYLHSLWETDVASVSKVIAVNMMGPYWASVAAARVMRERGGGSIVNLSSGGGAIALTMAPVYAMTKAAVNSLTWTSAKEFGANGIRVNAIAPGWIETPMTRDHFRDETGAITPAQQDKVRKAMAEQSPLKILGRPSDIAFALLYLASDASRFVTGQIIDVEGGTSL
jgi:3-oxoacyl-[acyl-carrier protein] reductase